MHIATISDSQLTISNTMHHRRERIRSLVHKTASQFLESQLKTDALVTVTGVDLSPDLRKAKVLISVRPVEKEELEMKEIKKITPKFINFIKKQFKMKYLPRFEFVIDEGEKKRQRVEEILQGLE